MNLLFGGHDNSVLLYIYGFRPNAFEVDGVSMDMSYDQLIDVFGEPDEEELHGDIHDLIYHSGDGYYIAISLDSVRGNVMFFVLDTDSREAAGSGGTTTPQPIVGPDLGPDFEWVLLPTIEGRTLVAEIKNISNRTQNPSIVFMRFDERGNQRPELFDSITNLRAGNTWRISIYVPNQGDTVEFDRFASFPG
jgi:hypothetical protein